MILGFYGVCPLVNVAVQYLSLPIGLSFLFYGTPGDGSFTAALDVVDEAEARTIVSTTGLALTATPNAATVLVATLLMTFGQAGKYIIRGSVDGQEMFRADFIISQATVKA